LARYRQTFAAQSWRHGRCGGDTNARVMVAMPQATGHGLYLRIEWPRLRQVLLNLIGNGLTFTGSALSLSIVRQLSATMVDAAAVGSPLGRNSWLVFEVPPRVGSMGALAVLTRWLAAACCHIRCRRWPWRESRRRQPRPRSPSFLNDALGSAGQASSGSAPADAIERKAMAATWQEPAQARVAAGSS
jgi:hypothetical protein